MASSETTSSAAEDPKPSDGRPLVELDGSKLEGGGQLVRNSAALSALLDKPLRIVNLRQGRSPPGLRKQHMHGIQVLRNLCNGDLEGAYVKSSEMKLLPGKLSPWGGNLHIDLETAGSVLLLIQAILPVLLFQPPPDGFEPQFPVQPTVVTIIGGTNATLAPQMDYFLHVFLPIVERMFGAGRVQSRIIKRGYYPKGGGHVRLEVMPLPPGQPLDAIDLVERGEVLKISGYFYSGGVIPLIVAQEMYEQAMSDLEHEKQAVKDRNPEYVEDFKVVREKAAGGGSGLVLWAETRGRCIIAGSAIGSREILPKAVAKEATSQLKGALASGVCVDEFLQDQLIIFMALAKGHSRLLASQPTLHTQTVMWIASELAGVEFSARQSSDGSNVLIECDGIGFTS